MAFSKRGKKLVKLKRSGEVVADETLRNQYSEYGMKRKKVRQRIERIEMMKKLKKDDLGW